MSSIEADVPMESIEEDVVKDEIFVPAKRAKSTIEHELSSYRLMYNNAIEDRNPLIFWKNAEQGCKFLINFKINF